MIKNKIIFSIFSAIFFANFSFSMNLDYNGANVNLNENEFNELRNTIEYQANLLEAYGCIKKLEEEGLPVMTPEQEQRFNNANTVRRRLNFNL